MSAMDQMLVNMLMKALPPGAFDQVVDVTKNVSGFIVETKEQLGRIENKLDKVLENDRHNDLDKGNDPITDGE